MKKKVKIGKIYYNFMLLILIIPLVVFCFHSCGGDGGGNDNGGDDEIDNSVSTVIGQDGGTIETLEGASLTIGSDVLSHDTSITIRYLTPQKISDQIEAANLSDELKPLGGIQVTLEDESMEILAKLSIPKLNSEPDNGSILFVKISPDLDGDQKIDAILIDNATIENDNITTSGLLLESQNSIRHLGTQVVDTVIGSGQYIFIGSPPTFFVKGEVPFEQAIVTTFDSLDIKSLSYPNGEFLINVFARPDLNGFQRVSAIAKDIKANILASNLISPLAMEWEILLVPKIPQNPQLIVEFIQRLHEIQNSYEIIEEFCQEPNYNKCKILKKMLEDNQDTLNEKLQRQLNNFIIGEVTPNPLWLQIGELKTVSFDLSKTFDEEFLIPTPTDLYEAIYNCFSQDIEISASVTIGKLKLLEWAVNIKDPNIAKINGKTEIMISGSNPKCVVAIEGINPGFTNAYAWVRKSIFGLEVSYNLSLKENVVAHDREKSLNISFKPVLNWEEITLTPSPLGIVVNKCEIENISPIGNVNQSYNEILITAVGSASGTFTDPNNIVHTYSSVGTKDVELTRYIYLPDFISATIKTSWYSDYYDIKVYLDDDRLFANKTFESPKEVIVSCDLNYCLDPGEHTVRVITYLLGSIYCSKEWTFEVIEGECPDIAGRWQFDETQNGTTTIDGVTSPYTIKEPGSIFIMQDGCNINWKAPCMDTYRTGTVNGINIYASGIWRPEGHWEYTKNICDFQGTLKCTDPSVP